MKTEPRPVHHRGKEIGYIQSIDGRFSGTHRAWGKKATGGMKDLGEFPHPNMARYAVHQYFKSGDFLHE
jgi:hypothetical protein